MPKIHTFPTLYDEVKTVSITDLKKWNYLKPNQWSSGTIKWSRNGNNTGSIGITVVTNSEQPYAKFNYNFRDEPVEYKVPLVTVPSNLGTGKVWYFLCPVTGKRCRKLYSVGKYFLHREAFTGCMYEKQTYSPKNRQLFKLFEKAIGSEKYYEQLYKKYSKKQYAGKPTKWYLRLMKKIRQREEFTQEEIERIYLM